MGARTATTAASNAAAYAWQAGIPTARNDTFANMTKGPGARVEAPAVGCGVDEMVEYVCTQLDSLEGATVCNGLTLKQGMHSRLMGGTLRCRFASQSCHGRVLP
jgi:hypothetical protein